MLILLVQIAVALNAAALAGFALLLSVRLSRHLAHGRRARRLAQLRSAFLGVAMGGTADPQAQRLAVRHPVLAAELLLTTADQVRGEALDRLGAALSNAGLAQRLVARLRRGTERDRATSAEALALLGEQALPVLRKAYERASRGERRALALILAGTAGAPSVLQLLSDFSGSETSPALLRSALRRVVALTGPDAVVEVLRYPALDGDTRAACLDAIEDHLSAGLLPMLTAEAAHPAPAVRVAALSLMGRLAHAGAVPALRLALSDGSESVRAAAAVALGRLGLPDVSDALAAALSDPMWSVRAASGRALLRLGPEGRQLLQAKADDRGAAGRAARLVLAGTRVAA